MNRFLAEFYDAENSSTSTTISSTPDPKVYIKLQLYHDHGLISSPISLSATNHFPCSEVRKQDIYQGRITDGERLTYSTSLEKEDGRLLYCLQPTSIAVLYSNCYYKNTETILSPPGESDSFAFLLNPFRSKCSFSMVLVWHQESRGNFGCSMKNYKLLL